MKILRLKSQQNLFQSSLILEWNYFPHAILGKLLIHKRPKKLRFSRLFILWEIAYSEAALSLEWLQKALFVFNNTTT